MTRRPAAGGAGKLGPGGPRLPPAQRSSALGADAVAGAEIRGDAAHPRGDVAFDSRDVTPGALFFCVPGATADGHAFAAQSAAAGRRRRPGGRAVAPRRRRDPGPRCRRCAGRWGPCLGRRSATRSAAMTIVGVTGTNGKTTDHVPAGVGVPGRGLRPGVVGTTGARVDGRAVPLARTTPEAPDLQRLLAADARRGVEAVAHGGLVARARSAPRGRCRFDVAVFTNLSQDHLGLPPVDGRVLRGQGTSCSRPARRLRAWSTPTTHWGRRLLDTPAIPIVDVRDRRRSRPASHARWSTAARASSFPAGGVRDPLAAAGGSTCRTAWRRWLAARSRGSTDAATRGDRGARRRPRPDRAGRGRAELPGGGGLRTHAG